MENLEEVFGRKLSKSPDMLQKEEYFTDQNSAPPDQYLLSLFNKCNFSNEINL